MTAEYIQTKEHLNSRLQTFELECKIKEHTSIYHVGLDCEYINEGNFPESYKSADLWTKKRNYKIAVCILILSSNNSCLIINLKKIGPELPSKLIELLQSGNWIKTGVGINNDMIYLADNFNLPFYSGVIDIVTIASLAEFKKPSLDNLSQHFNIIKMKKKKENSIQDWSKSLTVEMIEYCSRDGFASYHLGELIIKNMISSLNLELKDNSDNIKIKTSIEQEKNEIMLLNEYAQKNNLGLPNYAFEKIGEQLFNCTCKFKGFESSARSNNKKQAKLIVTKQIYDIINQI